MRIKLALFRLLVLVSLVLTSFTASVTSAVAAAPVVHAVLFFSPTCGACHTVIEQVLPPLVERYQEQLDIVGIDVSQPAGLELLKSAASYYKLPENRFGVPTMIIGNTVLVGGVEIPAQLPDVIDRYLREGGAPFPLFPGLQEALAAQPATAPAPAPPAQTDDRPLFILRFLQDPLANSIAVLVLLGMIITLILVGLNFLRGQATPALRWPAWLTLALALAGLGVAVYLTYVEGTGQEAICGPVGDCNTVQKSSYAFLFGVIPVGLLGMLGYLAILAAWLAQRFGPQKLKQIAAIAAWGMAFFGVLFSIYLTFLEPFVIGATCAWCITSAILMTLLLIATLEPAKDALRLPDDEALGEEEEAEEPLDEATDEAQA